MSVFKNVKLIFLKKFCKFNKNRKFAIWINTV